VRLPSRSFPAALCAGAALLLALSAAGCSNTCEYGSKGSNGSSGCKSRPDPSDEQASGYRAASLTPRFEALRRSKEARDGIDTITVNRWGEIGVRRDGDLVWTSNIDGKTVKKTGSLTAQGRGSDPFEAKDADPRALQRAMSAITERKPDAEFISGVLGLTNPRVPGGADINSTELLWTVTTMVGKDYAYYETDGRGRPQCVILSTDNDGSCDKV
jgi:hypothetical protein